MSTRSSSYDDANLTRGAADRRVTFIMNVIPGQDPADGPNYFNFDDEVLYRINIDNDQDGKAEDIVYEFRFKTETRPVGGPGGLTAPLPTWATRTSPGRPLQGITALDGAGSEGLTRRQTYTVTEIRDKKKTQLFKGRTLVAVPSNVGPATMPDYPSAGRPGLLLGRRQRHPRVRGAARRDVLHRPRRGLRHGEPAPQPAAADGTRRGRGQRESLRRQPVQRGQRQHHRDRGADQAGHPRRQAGRRGKQGDRALREHQPAEGEELRKPGEPAQNVGARGCRCPGWAILW